MCEVFWVVHDVVNLEALNNFEHYSPCAAQVFMEFVASAWSACWHCHFLLALLFSFCSRAWEIFKCILFFVVGLRWKSLWSRFLSYMRCTSSTSASVNQLGQDLIVSSASSLAESARNFLNCIRSFLVCSGFFLVVLMKLVMAHLNAPTMYERVLGPARNRHFQWHHHNHKYWYGATVLAKINFPVQSWYHTFQYNAE